MEDRIREGKAAGLRNFPCRGWEENNAWLEAVLAAADLVCWAKLICFAAMPSLARREIAAFRYRVLHVAAQLTRSARRTCLRIDCAWRWAAQIAEGFRRLRLTSPYRVLTITGRRQPAHQQRRCPRRGIIPALATAGTQTAPAHSHPPTRNQDQIRRAAGGSEAA